MDVGFGYEIRICEMWNYYGKRKEDVFYFIEYMINYFIFEGLGCILVVGWEYFCVVVLVLKIKVLFIIKLVVWCCYIIFLIYKF